MGAVIVHVGRRVRFGSGRGNRATAQRARRRSQVKNRGTCPRARCRAAASLRSLPCRLSASLRVGPEPVIPPSGRVASAAPNLAGPISTSERGTARPVLRARSVHPPSSEHRTSSLHLHRSALAVDQVLRGSDDRPRVCRLSRKPTSATAGGSHHDRVLAASTPFALSHPLRSVQAAGPRCHTA